MGQTSTYSSIYLNVESSRKVLPKFRRKLKHATSDRQQRLVQCFGSQQFKRLSLSSDSSERGFRQ
jgi:hypothetical protein